MERADYLMWMKKRPIFTSNYQASMKSNNESSWEERAFGQDAAGPLGGCLWPPRCYSCGFCRREFRSAQALGGHMNVHRRDRARLRQSPSSHQDEDDDAIRQQQHLEHSKTASIPSLWESRQNFPSELRTLHYDRLDPYSSSGIAVSSSTLSSSRFSALPNRENLSDHTFLSLKVPPSSYNILESDCLAVAFSESAPNSNREQNQREKDSSRVNHDQSVDTELLMGLNSIISQIPPFSSRSGDEGSSCKRPKTTVSAFSFLIKPDTNGRYALQSEVSEPNSSSMEDVDLELRLGEPPKGK